MRSIIIRIFMSLMVSTALLGQSGFYGWNQRTHSELTWYTLETEHFNIHYHNGIEEIARKGALIAEQIYPTILQQIEVEP